VSAEVLRRAAALMRERANEAVPSPWHIDRTLGWDCVEGNGAVYVAEFGTKPDPNAEHIASWHPAVALTVADLFDAAATSGGSWLTVQLEAAARAYLGDDQ
jgi:hypothetical protein